MSQKNIDNHCVICKKEMEIDERPKYSDYTCRTEDDHFFAKRIKDDTLLKLKVRFSESGSKIYLKINFDEGFSEVWSNTNTKGHNNTQRVRIDSIFEPDFSDIQKIKSKIITYLTFS